MSIRSDFSCSYAYHGPGAEGIPCDEAHTFLCENNGLGGGLRISADEGVAIAQRWHEWFRAKAVPHICELDAEGHVLQIFRHYWFGEPCCPLVQQLRRPPGRPRGVTAPEERACTHP